MPKLVSVDDTTFTLPAVVKVADANLPANLQPAALSATYGTVLVYSGGTYPVRPAGAVAVTYIGPVQPTGWLANDTWKDNS